MIRAALALVLMAGAASAQGACQPREDVVRHLTDRFGELPQVRGLDAHGRMYEVWAGQAGGWTVVRTLPDGRACVLDGGEWFSRLSPKFGEPT